MGHPKERPTGWAQSSRRDFLTRSGGAALALSSLGPLLAGCSNSSAPPAATGAGGEAVGPGGIPLARPDRPVTLPIYADNKAIASGLSPEKNATLTIFNYPDYLYKKLLKDFEKEFNCSTVYTSFDSMDQAVAKLSSGQVHADVMFPTPDRLDQFVAAKLLQPINLDYIPNLEKNVWPELHSPFYDVGSRYTVPYTTYTTGIAWRTDKITEDIPSMPNPWDIFWNSSAYTGKVGLLDDSREALVAGMLHHNNYDINTEDPKVINAALADIQKLISICNIKVDITQYQSIPEGTSYLHHAWSGDMIAGYLYYMPPNLDPAVLRYWWAGKGKAPIQNDNIAVLRGSKSPVLAHAFLNFMLDQDVAYSNFVDFNGYQPPQNSLDPDTLIAKKVVPPTLEPAIVKREDFGPDSLQEMTLTTSGQSLWQNAYSEFLAGS